MSEERSKNDSLRIWLSILQKETNQLKMLVIFLNEWEHQKRTIQNWDEKKIVESLARSITFRITSFENLHKYMLQDIEGGGDEKNR